MSGVARHRSDWRLAGISLTVLLLSVLLMYRGTVRHVVDVWSQWDSGYSHGYLALAISGYLVYRLRKVLAGQAPCPSFTALAAIAGSSLLWLLAAVAGVLMVQTVALLLVMVSVIWAVCGDRLIRHLLFPVLVIAFALPVWTPLQPLLQDMTADAVNTLARLLGLPVFRQEYMIVLPSGRLAISEACSGLSYLLAALTLGVLYAYLNYRRAWSRLLVVLVAAATAILANIVRVLVVVYLAYRTGMQHPLVDDHFNLGWYLFGSLVVVLLLVDIVLSRYAGGVAVHAPGTAGTVTERCRRAYSTRMLMLFATLLLAAAGPSLATWLQHRDVTLPDSVPTLPGGAGGWEVASAQHDDWMPLYHGALSAKQLYLGDGQAVYLYIGYYPQQSQGSELISDLNRIGDGRDWVVLYPRAQAVATAGLDVLEQQLQSAAGTQRLVWYWYRVAGRNTTSRYMAKVLQLLGFVTGKPQAAVFAVAADTGTDLGDARRVLSGFLAEMRPLLERVGDGDLNENRSRGDG